MARNRDIAVALSGGGFRAAAFALGAMIYISETTERWRVGAISSVSGGSLTNGFLARDQLWRSAPANSFLDSAASFAQRLAHVSINVRILFVRALAGPALIGVAALVLVLLAPWSPGRTYVGILVWAIALALLTWAALLSIDYQVERRFCDILGEPRRPFVLRRFWVKRWTSLADLAEQNTDVRHIFCATDLEDGRHFYLSPDMVLSARFGPGSPGPLTLLTAVRASAGFPGAFPPVRIRKGEIEWGTDAGPDRRLYLVDGGVYDNLGAPFDTTTAAGSNDRWPADLILSRIGESGDVWRPEISIVVNSSAVPVERTFGRLGRVLARTRIGGVIHAMPLTHTANTMARARALRYTFESPVPTGPVAGGIVMSLQDNPARICEELGHDAVGALQELGVSVSEWDQIAASSSQTPTDLGASSAVIEQLVFHGYWAARVRCQAQLGFAPVGSPGLPADWLTRHR